MTTTDETKLTPEVKAMIGVRSEFVEFSWWIIEKEELRRFNQALMDPDPRFWDEEFAKSTRYGEVITPPNLRGTGQASPRKVQGTRVPCFGV